MRVALISVFQVIEYIGVLGMQSFLAVVFLFQLQLDMAKADEQRKDQKGPMASTAQDVCDPPTLRG